MALSYSKTDFAARLGVTKARVSQLVFDGLPVQPDGRIDAIEGCGWVLKHLTDIKARYTRDAARKLMHDANVWNIVQAVVGKVPQSVVLGAGVAGLQRDQAERVANMTLLFLAEFVTDDLAEMGLPEMLVPHPEVWPKRVNWPALFQEDGTPRPEPSEAAALV